MTQVDRSADGPTTEKRTTPRIGVELWAEECCGADVYFHRVTNLSRDGFFIEKKLPFQAGRPFISVWISRASQASCPPGHAWSTITATGTPICEAPDFSSLTWMRKPVRE
jgi:hypothetical protein